MDLIRLEYAVLRSGRKSDRFGDLAETSSSALHGQVLQLSAPLSREADRMHRMV